MKTKQSQSNSASNQQAPLLSKAQYEQYQAHESNSTVSYNVKYDPSALSRSTQSMFWWGIISVLLPIIGVIEGLSLFIHKERRNARICGICALCGYILWFLMLLAAIEEAVPALVLAPIGGSIMLMVCIMAMVN